MLTALRRHRAAPFLGTLKRFGAASGELPVLPGPGWSLAVDVPAGNRGLRTVLDHLDRRVAELGGRSTWPRSPAAAGHVRGHVPPAGPWRAARERLDPRGVFCSDLAGGWACAERSGLGRERRPRRVLLLGGTSEIGLAILTALLRRPRPRSCWPGGT